MFTTLKKGKSSGQKNVTKSNTNGDLEKLLYVTFAKRNRLTHLLEEETCKTIRRDKYFKRKNAQRHKHRMLINEMFSLNGNQSKLK